MYYTSKVSTASTDILGSIPMQIEANFAPGFSGLQLIGNASEVCKDGRERARSALESSGVRLPNKKILLSLHPGEVKKDGSHFDLPLGLAIAQLVKGHSFEIDTLNYVFAGELSLNGDIKPVRGAISYALHALSSGASGLVVSESNLEELSVLMGMECFQKKNLKVIGFKNLSSLLSWAGGEEFSGKFLSEPLHKIEFAPDEKNFDDMQLSKDLERVALTVAVGHHSVLLRGTPGVGKSMFSERLNCLLPKMNPNVHLDALKIHSYLSSPQSLAILLSGRPPFRAPHHSASAAALLGSADFPGELALAHGGVLFLDELPEFRRDLIEALREPLESGSIRISRAKQRLVWKTNFLLVAACNNCPCGWLGSSVRQCSCPISKIQAYQRKLSGPILDRIDLHVNLSQPPVDEKGPLLSFTAKSTESKTEALRGKVVLARAFGNDRLQKYKVTSNSELPAHCLVKVSTRDEVGFLKMITDIYPQETSTRSLIRSMRVARTLADLDESEEVTEDHLLEASQWLATVAARARGENF